LTAIGPVSIATASCSDRKRGNSASFVARHARTNADRYDDDDAKTFRTSSIQNPALNASHRHRPIPPPPRIRPRPSHPPRQNTGPRCTPGHPRAVERVGRACSQADRGRTRARAPQRAHSHVPSAGASSPG
jgi:hypothetical protein